MRRRILTYCLATLVASIGFTAVSANLFASETGTVTQQSKHTVKGVIMDGEYNVPMAGATIQEKGTSNGTIADVDGNYSIKVSDPSATIEVKFIGYGTEEIALNGQSVVNVTLMISAEKLNDVVITALGISKEQKMLGYAATQLDGAEIAETNMVNPVAGIVGKSAGVLVNATDGGVFGGAKIEIRGSATLSGSNQPIYVIDGVILANSTSGGTEWSGGSSDWGNSLKNLNPDDFETMNILKGAAATALYGSRGINGAVVITTKSGSNGKGKITVSQTIGVDVIMDTPGLQYEFGAGTLAGYVGYGDKDENGDYYAFDYTQQSYGEAADGNSYPSLLVTTTSLDYGPAFDPSVTIIGYDGGLEPYVGYKNNMRDAYDTGFNSNTNVSLSGGNDKTQYYLSNSYKLAKGTYPSNQFNRNSFMVKGSHKFSDKLQASGSVNLSISTPKNPVGSLGNMFIDGGWSNQYDVNKYKHLYKADHGGIPSSSYGDALSAVPGMSTWFSINENVNKKTETVVRPVFDITVGLTDKIALILGGNANLETVVSESKTLGTGYANEGGDYTLGHSTTNEYTGKVNAKYNTQFSEGVTFNVFAGAEVYTKASTSSSVSANGGLIVPGQYFIGNSVNTPSYSASVSGEKQMASVYAMVDLGYKDQLYINASVRNDWSSTLVRSDGEGEYSILYPSLSASWLAHETFDLPSAISFAKIRGSIAQTGNDYSAYSINPSYSIGNITSDSGLIYTQSVPTAYIDPTIQPEMKTSIEFGTDIRLFNDRLGLDVTWYKENTRNQIMSISGNAWTGISSQTINAGNIQNSGIEIALNTTPLRSMSGVTWNMDFTYTRNRSKIIELHETVDTYKTLAGTAAYGNFRVSSAAYIGGEYGALMSDSSPEQDENGNDLLTWNNSMRGAYRVREGVVKQVGSMQPKFLASVNNEITYKNFNVKIGLDARVGGNLASFNNRYGTAYGGTVESLKYRTPEYGGIEWTSGFDGRVYEDGMIPEGVFESGTTVTTPGGASQDVGGMSYREAYDAGYVEPTHASYNTYSENSWGTGVINDTWFSELSYIALRSISVGYKFNNELIEPLLGVSNLSLALSGRNLGYLYNSLPSNLNPESTRGNSSNYSYFERTYTPYTGNFSFTVKFDL